MYLPYCVGPVAKINGVPVRTVYKVHKTNLKENEAFLQNFLIVGKATRGGYSTVYEAFRKPDYCKCTMTNEPLPSRKLIIKCVRKIEHQTHEVELLKRLKHDNIVKLLDVIRVRNNRSLRLESLTIVTEYGGRSLRKLIGRRRGLDPLRIRSFCEQIFDAVRYLHSERIVHRDLKPANIVCDEATQRVKIIDFGLAIVLDPRQPNRTRSGTLSYMAPETLASSSTATFANDMWSLGCIVLEMCTGRQPFAIGSVSVEEQRLTIANWCQTPDGNGAIPIEAFLTNYVRDLEYRDLIGQLLVYESAARFTISQAIEHHVVFHASRDLDDVVPESLQQHPAQKRRSRISKLLNFFKFFK